MNHYLFKPIMSVLSLLCFTVQFSFAQDVFTDNNELSNGTIHYESNDPVPTCLKVANLQNISISSTSFKFRWQHYPSIYTESYHYKLVLASNPQAAPVKSGVLIPPPCVGASSACLMDLPLSGLTLNTTYIFEVRRKCVSGLSDPTTMTVKTLNNIPDCVTPNNITAIGGNSTVTFNVHSDSPMTYIVDLLKNGSIIESKNVTTNGIATASVVFNGLSSCTDYVVRVAPNCSNPWNQNLLVSTPCCGEVIGLKTTDVNY